MGNDHPEVPDVGAEASHPESNVSAHSDPHNLDVDGRPPVADEPHPLTMVYGGGGVFGIAYCVGVAHGLAATGIPVERVPALGTSAGSWAAAALALEIGYDAIAALKVPPLPNTHQGVLAAVARTIFDEATHPLVAASAVCVRTRRRHILDGGRIPLADCVAASSAVPGLLPPHRIDGRLYVDGGMWSATSLDAAATAQHTIVVAPLAGSTLGPIGNAAGLLLSRELRTWQQRHPQHLITLIRPNRDIARLAGHNPMGLFDADRATQVYPLAYAQGVRWGERLLGTGDRDGDGGSAQAQRAS